MMRVLQVILKLHVLVFHPLQLLHLGSHRMLREVQLVLQGGNVLTQPFNYAPEFGDLFLSGGLLLVEMG